jgi:hypothetical protein
MKREELCPAIRGGGRRTEAPGYVYVRVAETVAARIEIGDITHRLPSERDWPPSLVSHTRRCDAPCRYCAIAA